MIKLSRELKTGIIAIGIIALFIWGFNFLKDQSIYDNSRTFYAEYTNVQGLAVKSAITINGFKVGSVSDISFHPTKPGVLVAHLNISDPILFSKNSVAQIYSPDFISGKSLKISLALDEAEIAQDGDTLVGSVDSGIIGMINEQIAPLQVKVESFVTNTDSVMQNVNRLLDDENRANLKSSLDQMNKTLSSFRKSAERMEALTAEGGSLDSLLMHTSNSMANIAAITDSIQKADLAASLEKMDASLSSMQNLLAQIEEGNGSLGKLVNDEALYENLTAASQELEELLREIKEHPKRFVHLSVFGKKEKPYQPSETDPEQQEQ